MIKQPSPIVAFFDLDNTLLPIDSDHGWGDFLVRKGYVDAAHYKAQNDYFFQQYQSGRMNVLEYCEFSFKVLADNEMSTLNQWHDEFMQEVILPVVLPQATELVVRHKQVGHIPVLISATNTFVITPIARRLGFEHIIGTQPTIENNRFTGKVTGTPSFQSGKVVRVDQWLQEQGINGWSDLAYSFFYTDSMNDLPLMERVTFPVATNPDSKLRELARERYWPVLDLFIN